MDTKKEGFRRRSKRVDLGEIEVLGTSYRLNYASRGKDSSYSSFSPHLWANFWVKMVEHVKGLFGHKNTQNPTFFA